MSEPYSQLTEGQRPWEERENEKRSGVGYGDGQINPDTGLVNGCPIERSGGPMAATVNKVLRRFSEVPEEWRFVRVDDLDAAIRRAAELAATDLCQVYLDQTGRILLPDIPTRIFERHVRRELGL